MSKPTKDNQFTPDELTAPLYEDGEKPKFDTGLKIVIGSVISLMVLGVLFFIFADKIKHWTGDHHPTIQQGTSSHVVPFDTISQKDSISEQGNESKTVLPQVEPVKKPQKEEIKVNDESKTDVENERSNQDSWKE